MRRGQCILNAICLITAGLLLSQAAVAGCTSKPAPGVDWSGCKKTNKILPEFYWSFYNQTNQLPGLALMYILQLVPVKAVSRR